MKLNVSFEIFDLSDRPLPEKAGRYIAEMLMDYKISPLKSFELGLKINKNKIVEIDTSDLKLVEEAVKKNERFNNLIKGAILKEIECQKSSANSDKKP